MLNNLTNLLKLFQSSFVTAILTINCEFVNLFQFGTISNYSTPIITQSLSNILKKNYFITFFSRVKKQFDVLTFFIPRVLLTSDLHLVRTHDSIMLRVDSFTWDWLFSKYIQVRN